MLSGSTGAVEQKRSSYALDANRKTCCLVLVQVLSSSIGAAPYCELALFHKKAKVLIVTDAVVYIPEDPPEVRLSARVRLLYVTCCASPSRTRQGKQISIWTATAWPLSQKRYLRHVAQFACYAQAAQPVTVT